MQVSIPQRFCVLMLALLLPLLASAATSAPSIHGEMDGDAYENEPRRTYALQEFSGRYRATLEIADNDEVFRPGIVRVYDKQTGAELIQVRSDELVLDVSGKSAKANVHELPYGEQSVLIHDDFNFDGIKDLAIMDGQFSCYHGPSFQVFLGTAGGFRHSDSFTELAQNYCGMFGYDPSTRQIHTMTKDGCCKHWQATYGIQAGEPVMETETVIDHTGAAGLVQETVARNVNGKMVSATQTLWEDDEGRDVLLAFRLAPSGKRVILFRGSDEASLYYAAVDDKDRVGLLYPEAESEHFVYDPAGHTLAFQRGDTVYRILADGRGVPVRMEVVIRGKTTELKLQPGSVKGSLGKVGAALQAAQ